MDAADLNALVDSGTALTGIIFDQTLKVAPLAPGDGLLLYDSEVLGGALKKTAISQLPGPTSVGLAMPTSEFTVTAPITTGVGVITVAWKQQPAPKFFAGNGTGGGLTPTFRPITSQDIALPQVNVPANTIDWSTGSVFVKGITADWSPTLTFGTNGQTIYVIIYQVSPGNFHVSWTGVRWSGGVQPVMSPTTDHTDIFQFWLMNGILFGQRVLTDAF